MTVPHILDILDEYIAVTEREREECAGRRRRAHLQGRLAAYKEIRSFVLEVSK